MINMQTAGRAEIERRIDEVVLLTKDAVLRNVRPGKYELDDIVQEALYGVLVHADKYDPARGMLSTFVDRVAKTWVWQRIFVCGQYAKRRINNETISLNETVHCYRRFGSGGDMDVERIDLIPGDEDTEYEATVRAEADRVWAAAEKVLSEKELRVLRGRYRDEETLEQIGSAIGLTRSRAGQIDEIAIGKLKMALNGKKP